MFSILCIITQDKYTRLSRSFPSATLIIRGHTYKTGADAQLGSPRKPKGLWTIFNVADQTWGEHQKRQQGGG